MEERLRHLRRRLARWESEGRAAGTAEEPNWSRLDAAHASSPGWHLPASQKQASGQPAAAGRPGAGAATLTWLLLLMGLTSSVCGGVLLGWSLLSDRPELWTIGMPIFLGGQIVLLTGFILQLDRLWNDNRQTAAKLDHVDRSLSDLSRAATAMGAGQNAPVASPHSHFGGGGNSQAFLADLKGQLDQLAVKIRQAKS